MAGADAQHDHASGEDQRLVHVVRHENHGLLQRTAGLPYLQQHVLLLRPRDGVERAERLVQEQDRGVHGQSAGDRGALPHAAGEFARQFAPGVRQADHRQIVVGDLAAFGTGELGTGLFERQHDIVGAGAPREQAVVLEHHGAVEAGAGDVLPSDEDLAGGGHEEPAHEPQQRAFAAAGRADDGDEFAGGHGEVDMGQSLFSGVGERQVAQLDERGFFHRF